MGWAIILLLAAAIGAGLWQFGRLPRGGVELLAAALMLALAGYAWQGHPNLPGRPTPPPTNRPQPDSAFAQMRGPMMERFGGIADLLAAADAFHRQGLDAYSVGILRGALVHNPHSADLWLGLGNALVLHNEGLVSPAAELAFHRAIALSPKYPAPPFFLGLAYAQAGDYGKAHDQWAAALALTPANAPWRRDLQARVAMTEILLQQPVQ